MPESMLVQPIIAAVKHKKKHTGMLHSRQYTNVAVLILINYVIIENEQLFFNKIIDLSMIFYKIIQV